MKSKLMLFAAAALVVGAVTFLVTDTGTYATQSPEEQVKQTVTNYIDALKSGDVEKVLTYVEDKRFNDVALQKEEYSRIAKNFPVVKAEVLSIKQVNETEMEATIEFVEKGNKTYEISLPVQKEDGQWKVIVTGKELAEKS